MKTIYAMLEKPVVSSVLYSITIMVLCVLASMMSILSGYGSGLILTGFIMMSVVITLMPATLLRYYSFGKLIRIKPEIKQGIALVFLLLELAIIGVVLTVYVSAVSGDGGGTSIFLMSLGNLFVIFFWGVTSIVLWLWGSYVIPQNKTIELDNNLRY